MTDSWPPVIRREWIEAAIVKGWVTVPCQECAGVGRWHVGSLRRLRTKWWRWPVDAFVARRPRRCRFCNGTGRVPAFPAGMR